MLGVDVIHPVSKPEPAETIPDFGVGSSCPDCAMPKRLSPAELDAATGAGGPPRSEDFEDDVEWHAAQDAWLNNWKPDVNPFRTVSIVA